MMSLSENIMSWLYAMAKRNQFLKSMAKPVYAFGASIYGKLRSLGKKRITAPPVTNVWDTSKEWVRTANKSAQEASYISVDQAQSLQRSLPKALNSQVFWKYHKNLEVDLPETYVLKLPYGRAYGHGMIINADNELMGDLSKVIHRTYYLNNFKDHPILNQHLPQIEFFKGKVAVLSVPFANTNYYHWLLDLLPRFNLIERAGIALESIDYFLVNDCASRFQIDTLRHLGIPKEKILKSQWYPHIQAEELIVPSYASETGDFSEWQCRWLKKTFGPKETIKPYRRIYLNRKNVAYRKILNEQALEVLLIKNGFESIDPADFTVLEQAKIFSEAEIVVAPHGAAMANLVFCQEGTRVIELLHHRAINLMFWSISNLNKLTYHYLLSEGKTPGKGDDPYENFVDMEFSVEKLSTLISSFT